MQGVRRLVLGSVAVLVALAGRVVVVTDRPAVLLDIPPVLGHLDSGQILVDVLAPTLPELTQERTPPARPTAYPVRNSLDPAPVPVGDRATSRAISLTAALLALLWLLNRAGL